MLAAIIIVVGGLLLVVAALFWPGEKNPYSGDSSNPFFIGDSLPKRKKKHPSVGSTPPMGTGTDSGGDSSSGFGSS